MKPKNCSLKVISYSENGNPREEVAYRVYPNRKVVFTGMYDGIGGARGSTTNFAGEIVAAIARKEGLDPCISTFWDLKTMTSCGGDNDPDYQPGSFRMEKLCPNWGTDPFRPVGMQWIEGYLSGQTLNDFSEFIWGDSERPPLRNLAVAYGSLPAQVPELAIA